MTTKDMNVSYRLHSSVWCLLCAIVNVIYSLFFLSFILSFDVNWSKFPFYYIKLTPQHMWECLSCWWMLIEAICFFVAFVSDCCQLREREIINFIYWRVNNKFISNKFWNSRVIRSGAFYDFCFLAFLIKQKEAIKNPIKIIEAPSNENLSL